MKEIFFCWSYKSDMRMSKKTRKNLIIILITLMTVFVIVYLSITNAILKDMVITSISLIAAIAVFFQIRQGTNIAKAEFVMNLQERFSDSKGFSELFMVCWNAYSTKNNQSVKKYLEENIDKGVLLNYLTFFESVYIMKEQGNLDFDILDELFGRRFFIIVTNAEVQNKDLVPNIAYYDNVKKLYIDWKAYREKSIKYSTEKNIKKTKFLEFDENSINIDLEIAIAAQK